MKPLTVMLSCCLLAGLVTGSLPVFAQREVGVPLDLSSDVRFIGRTYTQNDAVYFNWSGAGFTFSFTGTGAKAELVSNAPSAQNLAYIKIYVDGKAMPDVCLTEKTQTVVLASGLDNAPHTIEVRKRTNARASSAGVKSVTLDAGSVVAEPTDAKDLYIEFIGDSLMVGYSTVANGATAWSTATEDYALTYVPAIANAFDADYGIVAISGRGVGRNIAGDTDKLLPYLYEYTDDYNLPGVKWNFSLTPDVIVINLGDNDEYALSATYRPIDFQSKYVQFLKRLRDLYPHAKILCTYGMDKASLASNIKAAVEARNDYGDNQVAYLRLNTATAWEIGHPTAKAYVNYVLVIKNAIQKLLDTPEATTAEEVTSAEPEELTTELEQTTENATAEPTTDKNSGCASVSALPLASAVAGAVCLAKKRKKKQ